jgi:hypothetical protein
MKKNRLEYLKKYLIRFQFWFHKPETEKLNQKNRAKSKPNPLEITKKTPKKYIF